MTSINRRLPVFSMRARLLVVVLAVAAIAGGAMLAWAVQAQREAAIAQARDFAQSVNQVTLVGLTAMMITGMSAQRNVFLDQIEHANSVDSLHVVRAPAVVAHPPRAQRVAVVAEPVRRPPPRMLIIGIGF